MSSARASLLHRRVAPLLRTATRRLTAALVVGAGAFLIARLRGAPDWLSLLAAWDLTGAALLAFSWLTLTGSDAARTQERAAAEDPGRTPVYLLVLVASAASLLSAIPVSRAAKGVAQDQGGLFLALCLATVALSWALTHTAFTLRYAHLYYRGGGEGVGGVQFPGHRAPDYLDFAYLAFTVGMCFQVSDATVSGPQIRRTVLLHGVLAFVYNTAILAFVLSLAFGRAAG